MHKELSFESQQLISEMGLMYWFCVCTGRQFYYTAPNLLKGHMEFLINRVKMIPFFVSTFLLWSSLIFIFVAFATVKWFTSLSDPTKTPLPAEQEV